jgi:hypothetical protein
MVWATVSLPSLTLFDKYERRWTAQLILDCRMVGNPDISTRYFRIAGNPPRTRNLKFLCPQRSLSDSARRSYRQPRFSGTNDTELGLSVAELLSAWQPITRNSEESADRNVSLSDSPLLAPVENCCPLANVQLLHLFYCWRIPCPIND